MMLEIFQATISTLSHLNTQVPWARMELHRPPSLTAYLQEDLCLCPSKWTEGEGQKANPKTLMER